MALTSARSQPRCRQFGLNSAAASGQAEPTLICSMHEERDARRTRVSYGSARRSPDRQRGAIDDYVYGAALSDKCNLELDSTAVPQGKMALPVRRQRGGLLSGAADPPRLADGGQR